MLSAYWRMTRVILVLLLTTGAVQAPVIAQVSPQEVMAPRAFLPADLTVVTDSARAVPLDLLGVAFRSGVAPDRKAELLNEAGARSIVGGAPHALFDGYYLVRFDPSQDVDRLGEKALRLNVAEEVLGAVLAPRVEASSVRRPPWVPSEPPDSVPTAVESLFGTDDAFLMIFEPDLSSAQKSAILDAVGASTTLGGAPFAAEARDIFDGIYLVALDRPSGFWDLSLAIVLLWELPGALTAGSITELVTN